MTLQESDPEIYEAIQQEEKRQHEHIELIASENFVSRDVMQAAGSVMTNKYAEGYAKKRYYGGCEHVDKAELLAIERLSQLFKTEENGYKCNVQPHSGANANLAVYLALVEAGDTVMGMDLSAGGHLTHGLGVNFSGKLHNIVSYGVNDQGLIDYEALAQTARECKPKMIIAGASAYPRAIDFKKFSDIAKEVGAYLFVDMAHIAGLVAAGVHESPIPYADVITSTTHKTLRGTRGGIIIAKEELAKKIDSAIFPGSQGGPLMHIIAGKAVAFKEALKPEFTFYQQQIVKNAKAMAETLQEEGINLVSGGTDNHMMLLDLRSLGITGKQAQHLLESVKITTNKNGIPNDPEKPWITSGIRVGTPAITTRGFLEEDCREVASLIAKTLRNPEDESIQEEVKKSVSLLCEKYPLYKE